MTSPQEHRDYRRVEAAIAFLKQRRGAQPDLKEVAAHVGLTGYHFQRVFRRWAGISPKRFLQQLTVQLAGDLLAERNTVLDVAYSAGLSGPGRLHDLFVAVEAMSPGEFRAEGAGIEIRYGVHGSPFGPCLLAQTRRGVCSLDFLDEEDEKPEGALARAWPSARLHSDQSTTARTAAALFDDGELPGNITLHLRGTNFQLQVWRALLRIPSGRVATYEGIAQAIDRPTAVRAVGGAVAKNPVALLIPCHRVIRKSGAIGDYRWGSLRKQAMLAREAVAATEVHHNSAGSTRPQCASSNG